MLTKKKAGNLSFMTFAAVYIVEIPFMCGLRLAKVTLHFHIPLLPIRFCFIYFLNFFICFIFLIRKYLMLHRLHWSMKRRNLSGKREILDCIPF
jgi:hypothetical protein